MHVSSWVSSDMGSVQVRVKSFLESGLRGILKEASSRSKTVLSMGRNVYGMRNTG